MSRQGKKMRKIILIGCLMLIGFQFNQTVSAQEADVYVDLSVLDSISHENYSATPNIEPLFPVYQKSENVKKEKTKPQAKKVSKKSQNVKVKVKKAKKEQQPVKPTVKETVEEKVVVVDVEPITQPKETKQPQTYKEVIYAGAEETGGSKASDVSKPDTQTAEVKVVDVEPSASAEATKSETENNVEKAVSESSPQPVMAKEKEKVVSEKMEEKATTAKQEEIKENKAPKPLIPETQTKEETSENKPIAQIKFASDVSELTEEQQKQLDAIVASFNNPSENKIAIYAYNLDDGVDSFKKKRLCLNRAVEIRSYLLQKGYKNFSIKVINVDGNSDKTNIVELEELK